MALALFLGMYVSRIFVLGPLGFLIGFIVAVSQSVGEAVPSPELLVRGLLWLWVAIVYGAGLTVVLNLLFLPDAPGPPAHPPKPKSFFCLRTRSPIPHTCTSRSKSLSQRCFVTSFISAIDWSGYPHRVDHLHVYCAGKHRRDPAQGCAQDRRLCDRRSTRALHHRLPHAAHGHNRVVDCGGGLCLCHCRLGRRRNRNDLLCGFTDCVRFFLQCFPGLCARYRPR